MKITKIESFATMPPNARSNYVFVKVSTDEGIVGWGESSIGATSVAGVIEEFGESILGKDPFRIEEHWQHMYHLHHNIRGGAIQMAAISGIEIALWDIKGKALGVPVYELLGGAMRDKMWAYGRFDGVDPDDAVRNATSFTAQGYTALKGDPFGHQGLYTTAESERDALAKVAAVREAVGDDVELLIEVHGRLTPSEAIRVGDALEQYRPFFFEEPVPPQNVDAMLKVANAINIPLATGERIYTKWGFKELLEKQVVAVVQPDVCHAGGISELKKIAAMAETYYVGFAPHNPYGPINTLAALHVDACTPNFLIQEGGHAPWYNSVIIGEFPGQNDGYFDLPTSPGIGIEMDEDAMKNYPAGSVDNPGGYRGRYTFGSKQQSHWV
ncbi:MAG: galactonate dehydratase [SAR202 cluster bacterium]|nr:galactonate dehydratase [SAR202 cluster bacterium]MDP6714995.1 galactonate dehydratase [SAR202 cluster bacterium]